MRAVINSVCVLALVGVSAPDAQAVLTATPVVATDAGDGNRYGGGSDGIVSPDQSSSTTNFAFNLTTGALRVSFNQQRTGATASFARASGFIRLLPDEQLNYTLSGEFELLGDNRVFQSVSLRDVSTGQALFDNTQDSRATTNENFSLGGEGGDFDNAVGGAISGTLEAGHIYHLSFDYLIEAGPVADAGAALASGSLDLQVHTNPTPSAAVVALIGLAIARRKSRRGCRSSSSV